MADQEQLDILKQGVEVWNKWRIGHLDIQPDLIITNQQKAELERINQRYADLSEAELERENQSLFDFAMANIDTADLVKADLSEVNLKGFDLRGVNLSYMNLSRADFSEANLSGANFSEAILLEANLSGATLSGATLGSANFRSANLSGADLRGAEVHAANLISADLSCANLRAADLSRADLSRADLSSATVGWTTFGNVDLSTVKGLDTIIHAGPSTIGIDTIYNSHGNISEAFLRKAGVQETFLTHMRVLVDSMRPIDFYSCFISYSSKDQDFAERIYADLQSNGVRCWFAPKDLIIGDKIRPRLDESIRLYDKLLLVLSQYSITSQWVEQEAETALEKERNKQHTVLFPIRLDDAVLEAKGGWPALIRNTRHIGDFTRWKDHDAYGKGLERLLHDLKAEA